MDNTLLKELQGKHISVIIQNTPHPSSGYLTDVGEGYITVTKDSGDMVIIVTSQIASILVMRRANGRTDNDNRGKKETF